MGNDIRKVASKYSNLKGACFDHRPTSLPPGLENMCCEVYNPGTEGNRNKTAFTMRFRSTHLDSHRMHFFGLPPSHWKEFECKPGEWVFLPHGQYIPVFYKDGKVHEVERYDVTIIVGDAMFTGEKLASRPDVKKIRSFNK